MQRLLAVRSGRHPHEILILIAASLIGLIGILFPDTISPAISQIFNTNGSRIFFGGMFAFAAIALYGVWKRKVEGLMIERGCLIALTCFFTAYSLSVLFHTGLTGVIASILPLSFAIANICRIVQIRTDIIYIQSYLNDHPGENS